MVVVVGFLANAEGRAALTVAVEEAQRRGQPLVVLAYPIRSTDGCDIENTVAQAQELLREAPVATDVRQPERDEDLAEELLRTAQTTQASVIVIGLRRRSPTGKLILGANAQRILLDSAAPVLAVKP